MTLVSSKLACTEFSLLKRSRHHVCTRLQCFHIKACMLFINDLGCWIDDASVELISQSSAVNISLVSHSAWCIAFFFPYLIFFFHFNSSIVHFLCSGLDCTCCHMCWCLQYRVLIENLVVGVCKGGCCRFLRTVTVKSKCARSQTGQTHHCDFRHPRSNSRKWRVHVHTYWFC